MCSIIVANAIGIIATIAEIASEASLTPPKTVDDHSIGKPIHAAYFTGAKSIAKLSIPNPFPNKSASK